MSQSHEMSGLSVRWAPTLHLPAQRQDAAVEPDEAFRSDDEGWEDAAKQASDSTGAPRTGVMVAFFPDPDTAAQLALPDGEPAGELHVTLAFLGEVGAELSPEDQATVIEAVSAWAAGQQPVSASTNGLGLFLTPDPVTYANVDSPQLPATRQSLVEALDAAGVAPLQNHGYTPHMTLAYADRRDITVPMVAMRFADVVVAFAGQRTTIPLTGTPAQSASLQVSERPQQPEQAGQPEQMAVPVPDAPAGDVSAKAFVADVNGRTVITAPATAAFNDPTVEDITAAPLLWMHGRFVGADVPNRNKALWSAGDLQLSRASVVNGPLNWLHEGRHIIGTLAKADYVEPARESAALPGGPQEPHITATAAIWRWIYPDEAYVVQQASDAQQLWYSMECISKEVGCAGPDGCGRVTSYSAYMAGAACEHVIQRASLRQFISPVFLGGAVIVPPTRPGWAEADAQVMNTAAQMAEAAYEQAGEPDMSSSAWEQVMAQVVKFARA